MTDFTAIRKQFEKNGFTTQAFATKEEVNAYLAEELKDQSIAFGGSVTLNELGLYETLIQNNAVVRHGRDANLEVRRLAVQAKIYITSANAVTEDGKIINIDGTGNRVSMTCFGPRKCYFIVGRNKITKDLAEGYQRCKNVAAPLNAQRLQRKTPCAAKGDRCYDCESPERICRVVLITERAPTSMESEIIFVDMDLGY
jgi:L-lactate utilization protein LutC